MHRNPCYYVLMAGCGAVLAWLVIVFVWHYGKMFAAWIGGQVLCFRGLAHRKPEIHLPEWEEIPIRVRRWGPVKDNWWSQGYYASVEYVVCRHKGCRAFKITRMIKDA